MAIFRKNKREFAYHSKRNYFVALFLFLVFGVSGIIALLLKANAQLVPVESVDIYSQHSNYQNREPGSWNVTKTAEWTDLGKARITFEIHSVPKVDYSKKLDVVMVIDNSGSMMGDKISQVKSDATDLIETLLLDSTNRISLVTFDDSAQILSGFTNNKTSLISYIQNIEAGGCTNYYDGLLKAETVLQGYVQQEGRELVLLFLTDGFPNIQTPNEVAQYHLLKELHPFMIVNGIQYEMGDTVLQPIIDISDNQFIASMTTLNNVLFEATITPYTYDDFFISDYINDDYWTIAGLEALEASLGEVGLEYDSSTPKVIWDLSGLYRSGQTATLTIEINLKPEFIDAGNLLLPTNKHETIESSLPDTPDEDKDSSDTPILKDSYDVIYDANAPDGCEVSGTLPETVSHSVFSTVEISDNKLSCQEYHFKGWTIATEKVERINNDYFRMPGKDVHLKAIWAGVKISKSMDGTAHVRGTAQLLRGRTVNERMKQLAGAPTYYSYTMYDDNITKIEKSDTPPADGVETRILSESNSQLPVYAWYDEGVIYYYSDAEEIFMNSDSSAMFERFRVLTSVDGLNGWDASKVTDMSSMFYETKNLTNIDGLTDWDTSKVTTMRYMFYQSGITDVDALATKTINGTVRWSLDSLTDMYWMFCASKLTNVNGLLDWDVSGVTNMSHLFSGASALTNINGVANWNVSNVTDMSYMFSSTNVTNLNALAKKTIDGVDRWNMTSATDLSYMFKSAGSLTDTTGVSNWNTSAATNMSHMFDGASSLTNVAGLANWDTSSVTNMSYMFNYNKNLTDISGVANWDTSSVTNMSNMFSGTENLVNLNGLTNWDTSSVTNMSYMFSNAGLTNIDALATKTVNGIVRWNVSNVKDMKYMFYWDKQLTNVNGAANWDTSSVTNMSGMFSTDSSLTNISGMANWDTSSVTNMSSMFSGCNNVTNLSSLANWDTSSVTNMSSMFSSVKMTNIDALATKTVNGVVRWNTANVTDMSSMFSCSYGGVLENINGALNWDTSSVTTMYDMFYGAVSLANINGALNWDVSSVTDMSGMFAYTKLPNIAGAINWDTSSVTTMRFMFYSVYTLTNINGAINWDVSKVKDTSSMFEYVTNLTNIDGAINWRFTSLENASEMFQHADSLENIDGAINWGLSSLKSASAMFDYAESLTNIDGAINWDLSSLTAMGNMLSGTYSLDNVNGAANWDTSNVTSMSGLLWASSVSNIDGLANWNTSNVTDMDYMLSDIDVTNVDAVATKVVDGVVRWDTSKVTRMGGTFSGIGREGANVSIDLSSWDTSNVTYMWGIFMNTGSGAQSLSINLSGWDTSKVTNMGNMFSYTGDRATSWIVKIPATNGGGINNTATSIYGSTTSVYGTPPSNRSFTLITP